MKQENFNIIHDSKGKYLPGTEGVTRKIRILVAPLDWGLGHATRCIPIIKGFLQQNCEVWLAGEGAQEELLKQEFPTLPFLPLAGYRVKYSRSPGSMWWKLVSQSSRILASIRGENKWLKEVIAQYRFDAVVSDNRFGLYHETVPCVFITHQLLIKTPPGKWAERLLQRRNYRYINRFSECWVPDVEGEHNLGGELSHPKLLPSIPVRYTGPLSRFNQGKFSANTLTSPHLLIVLSGPEPQRTLFEDKIINDIAHYNGSATIVRGLPGTVSLVPSTRSLQFYNHLAAAELNKEMERADYIISRSGYSTVMDITRLKKKSILIPTPGQSEQEYLGRYLQEKKIALTIAQKNFSLSSALQAASAFRYEPAGIYEDNLAAVIAQFVEALHKH